MSLCLLYVPTHFDLDVIEFVMARVGGALSSVSTSGMLFWAAFAMTRDHADV